MDLFRIKIGVCLISLLAVLALPAEASVSIETYSMQQGLSSRLVKCFYQDSKGFVWIGTLEGLNRFDGVQFKAYYTSSSGKRLGTIMQLMEGPDQWLWIKTLDDLYLLDLQTNTLLSYEERFGKPLYQQFKFYFLGGNLEMPLLWTRDDEVVQVGPDGEQMPLPFEWPHKLVSRDMYQTGKLILVDEAMHALTYDLSTKEIVTTCLPGPGRWVGLMPDGKFLFRIARMNHLSQSYFVTWAAGQPVQPFLHNKLPDELHMKNAFYDRHHNLLYLAGENAFYQYDIEQQQLIDHSKALQEQLGEYSVNYMVSINPNALMISLQDGVGLVNIKADKFTTYLGEHDLQKVSSWKSIRGMLYHQNKLYANAPDATFQIDLSDGKATPLLFPGETYREEGQLNPKGPILKVANDQLLFFANPIYWYDPQHHQFQAQSYIAKNALDTRHLWMDTAQTLWIGSSNGLWYITAPNPTIAMFDMSSYTDAKLQPSVNAFLPAGSGKVWLCTANGLLLFDPINGVMSSHITAKLPNGQPFRLRNIMHAWQDERGVFWLATNGHGLLEYDPEQGTVSPYTLAHGLSNMFLHCVYPDQRGHLWISSNHGLIRFNRTTKNCRVYYEENGIAHNEFNKTAHAQAPDGRLFLGGLNGITAFHPKDFDEDTTQTAAHLQVTSYQQLDGNTGELVNATARFLQEGKIVLEPEVRVFQLRLALLDYFTPANHRFFYQIPGFLDQWQKMEGKVLQINGLPYGNHVLKLKAMDATGKWTAQTLEIPVQVQWPLWLQPWFIALILVSVGGLVWYRFHSLKKAKTKVEKIVEERTLELQEDKATIEQQAMELRQLDEAKSRFFANISHELRTPLTLMMGVAAELQNGAFPVSEQSTALLDMLTRNGKQLQQYINELLDLSRLDSRQLQLNENTINWTAFLKQTIAAFESLARHKQLEYTYTIDLPEELGTLVDANKARIILNNLISNAIKFTPANGKVSIHATRQNDQLQLRVMDTGPGIDSKEQALIFNRFYQIQTNPNNANGGMGIGLSISKEYAQMMKGTLDINSTPGTGATFTLTLPFQPSILTSTSTITGTAHLPVTAATIITPPSNGNTDLPHLLVVEDNPDMLAYLTLLLQPHFKLTTAHNGKLGLEKLQLLGEDISLILSDVMMPEMDGFTFLEKVKAEAQWANLPFVILTAKAGLEDKLNALRIGVDDYLAKPFEPEELLARLQNLLLHQKAKLEEDVDAPQPTIEASHTDRLADREWLQTLETQVKKGIDTGQVDLPSVADNMHLSDRQLRRKLKQLTGLTPNKYILEIRLQKGRELLEIGAYSSLKEVSHAIGFNTPWYFAQEYEKRFGRKASSYFVPTLVE